MILFCLSHPVFPYQVYCPSELVAPKEPPAHVPYFFVEQVVNESLDQSSTKESYQEAMREDLEDLCPGLQILKTDAGRIGRLAFSPSSLKNMFR